MTTYQGGKKRLSTMIHSEITKFEYDHYKCNKLPYMEPFMGMASVMSKFGTDDDRDLYGTDINEDVVELWKALQNGWKPPLHVSITKYNKLKQETKPSAARGFVGSACSFGGQFFMGYKSIYDSQGKEKNYAEIGWGSIQKVLPSLLRVNVLDSCSYDQLKPSGMLIYCDPPYKDNKIHTRFFQNFDHELFWNVMREWSKNNLVIISELQAPEDFVSIWKQEYKVSFMKHGENKVKNFVEQLFVYKDLQIH
jgi:DNA adenine methylase